MSERILRQVVLDTETTGLRPQDGHRIIEIGCVEMINRRLTGNHFHVYINPERLVDDDAIAVHGITNAFLEDKPRFADIVDDYLAFTQESELIIHNAPFDVGFLNHELTLLNRSVRVEQRSVVFDTLPFARKKYPGARASLDALCKRFGIDNSHRELHGALLDAQILADVYLAMTGGQFSLLDLEGADDDNIDSQRVRLATNRSRLTILRCNAEEQSAHEARLLAIEKITGNCIWKK